MLTEAGNRVLAAMQEVDNEIEQKELSARSARVSKFIANRVPELPEFVQRCMRNNWDHVPLFDMKSATATEEECLMVAALGEALGVDLSGHCIAVNQGHERESYYQMTIPVKTLRNLLAGLPV